MGIIKIMQISKMNESYKMVRAECLNEEAKDQLVKNGIKLDFFSLKVENYIRPIRPTQCFNCQKFDHIANVFPNVNHTVCLKCGGEHNVEDCERLESKCVNCDGEHKSNSQECEIYVQKLNVKINSINNNNSQQNSTTIRKYSQATNNKQDMEEMKDSIIKSIKAVNELIQTIFGRY